MSTLFEDLRAPDAFARPCPRVVTWIETHLSWVYLIENDVFKIKRPVEYGFVDFRELEQRKRACEAEVILNRRLAPDVYQGIVPIYRTAAGNYRWYGEGPVVEWAVHMSRLADADRADLRLARGHFGQGEIDMLAKRLTTFHQQTRCDEETSAFGSIEVIEYNVKENFSQMYPLLALPVASKQLRAIETWQLRYLEQHRGRFAERQSSQRIRDGHGDLRLEHIYIRDEMISIIDCIEFNDRFRFGDVGSDLGFLAMDFRAEGYAAFAEQLLARYAREANDYGLYGVIDFYTSYRALVRAKVNLLLAADANASASAREGAHQRVEHFLQVAHDRCQISSPRPTLLLVSGMIAAGKSTVAEMISSWLAAPIVDADRTRKHLLCIEPQSNAGAKPWQGQYHPDVTEQVYDELLRRAERIVTSGRSVIIDASFRSRALRDRFRMFAASQGIAFRLVECWAERTTVEQRLRDRVHQLVVSDARVDLLESFWATYEPPHELDAAKYHRHLTDAESPQQIDALRAFVLSL